MKTSLMPCSRKAASQSRLSTFLTMMRGPTLVFWTVETVLGMWVFPYVIVYAHIFICAPTSVALCTQTINGLHC